MNILLCCAMGMSTSIVVQSMKKAAARQGKDYKIWAIDADSVCDEDDHLDVILIGPQVGFRLDEVREMLLEMPEQNPDIPIAVIDKSDYGSCNGEVILEFAEKLAKIS
ncbi:MAG: PTS sugar transporter subunit IIB [Lachnospiraceae bacterium]